MNVQGFAALATLILHFLTSAGGGLEYLCKIDGQARRACCCARERHFNGSSTVSSQGCCDVRAFEANWEPTLPDKRTADPVPTLFALTPPSRACLAQIGSTAAEQLRPDLPPPGGPPLFLRIRTLLI
jgi:hypothetical protein